jgi:predicted PurR-regulated permease PerM
MNLRLWVKVAAGLAALALLVWGLVALRGILTPFAIAFAIAYMLNPLVNWMEGLLKRWLGWARWLSPRALSVGLLCLGVVAALVLVVLVVVPTAYQQVRYAAGKVPDYVRTVQAKVGPLVERLNLEYPVQVAQVRQELEKAAKAHALDIVAPVTRIIQAVFSSALSLFLAIVNLVIIPVFAVYLLFDMNRIKVGLRDLVPHRYREYIFARTRAIDQMLSAFVRGQVTVCLMLGSFYAIALTACGVPMGLPVGFTIGFFNLVPYMSHVLGLPLALLLSWLDDQSWQALIAVTAVFFFGQLVEGNFITPRVVGEKLGLHAVVVMLAVIVGATLFGFIGMFLAVPVTACMSVFWDDIRALYLRSEFFKRGSEP